MGPYEARNADRFGRKGTTSHFYSQTVHYLNSKGKSSPRGQELPVSLVQGDPDTERPDDSSAGSRELLPLSPRG